jgi:hypothetical protein
LYQLHQLRKAATIVRLLTLLAEIMVNILFQHEQGTHQLRIGCWPQEGVDTAGRNVAVIGTGECGIQVFVLQSMKSSFS